MLEVANSYLSLERMLLPMMYGRDTVAQTVKPKATTRIRSYWWGNSDDALDSAGVK